MGSFKVRAASLFVQGKKAGEFEGTEYTIDGNDEAQIGEDFLGYSDGVILTSLTATGIHPVGGMSIPDLMQAMLDKKDLDIALSLINGKIHQLTMRVTQAKTTSSHRNGTQQGQYTLGGGKPVLT